MVFLYLSTLLNYIHLNSWSALSQWCILHRKKANHIVETWEKYFNNSPNERRIPFLYLANDILQNSRRKGSEFVNEFWKVLAGAMKSVYANGNSHGKHEVIRLVSLTSFSSSEACFFFFFIMFKKIGWNSMNFSMSFFKGCIIFLHSIFFKYYSYLPCMLEAKLLIFINGCIFCCFYTWLFMIQFMISTLLNGLNPGWLTIPTNRMIGYWSKCGSDLIQVIELENGVLMILPLELLILSLVIFEQ